MVLTIVLHSISAAANRIYLILKTFLSFTASEPRKNCGVKRKKSEKDEIDDNDDDNADVEDDVEQVEVDDNDNDNADGDDDVEQVEDDDTADRAESMADHAESKTHQTFDI